jgi:hypothetical protein
MQRRSRVYAAVIEDFLKLRRPLRPGMERRQTEPCLGYFDSYDRRIRTEPLSGSGLVIPSEVHRDVCQCSGSADMRRASSTCNTARWRYAS